jgi:hypothetical protein
VCSTLQPAPNPPVSCPGGPVFEAVSTTRSCGSAPPIVRFSTTNRAVQHHQSCGSAPPIVRFSTTNRAREHQWWCGSAPRVLPVTDYALAKAVCSRML